MNNEELKKVYSAINDVWDFLKKFYTAKDDDAFWEELYKAEIELSKKHKSLFMDNLLIVCIDDIETRFNQSQNRPVDELEHFRHIVHVLERDRKKEG